VGDRRSQIASASELTVSMRVRQPSDPSTSTPSPRDPRKRCAGPAQVHRDDAGRKVDVQEALSQDLEDPSCHASAVLPSPRIGCSELPLSSCLLACMLARLTALGSSICPSQPPEGPPFSCRQHSFPSPIAAKPQIAESGAEADSRPQASPWHTNPSPLSCLSSPSQLLPISSTPTQHNPTSHYPTPPSILANPHRLLHTHLTLRILDPSLLAPALRTARAALFPHNAPGPPRVAPDADAIRAIRRRCAEGVLGLVPGAVAGVYFGGAEGEGRVAQVEEVLEVFGDAYMNRHLLYAVVDLVVARLLPEMRGRGVSELRAERLGCSV